ncbi:MAG: hypothetical protein IKH04_11130, partial [Kiritimatiellae bacterium]|nr:hypothetical protein [Kiritimatiellia bacterium]
MPSTADAIVSPETKVEFLRLAARRYFEVVAAAIRRHDPNHLLLGARFAGLSSAHQVVWEEAGKICDILTFNNYPWADLDENVVYFSKRNGIRAADAYALRYGCDIVPFANRPWFGANIVGVENLGEEEFSDVKVFFRQYALPPVRALVRRLGKGRLPGAAERLEGALLRHVDPLRRRRMVRRCHLRADGPQLHLLDFRRWRPASRCDVLAAGRHPPRPRRALG